MEERIQEFIAILRHNGVRVSISENLDALDAVTKMGIADKRVFRDSLRATLIKSRADIEAFNDLFQIFFSGLSDLLNESRDNTAEELFDSPIDFQEFLNELENFLEAQDVELTDLMRMVLLRENTGLDQLIRQTAQNVGTSRIQNLLQEGFFTRALLSDLEWYDAMPRLERLADLLRKQKEPTAFESQLLAYVERAILDFPRTVRDFVRQEREKNSYKALEKFRAESLSERNFNYLTRDEVERMQEMVARLAQRLKQIVSIKRKRMKHGTLDVKGTIRKNLQYGGVPFNIKLHNRKKQKPQIVLLCDVSDSVRTASLFMLLFTYSIQELFQKVRSFIFVSQLGEVTQLFKDKEINQAIEEAYTGTTISLFSHSNFGNAFRIFYQDYLHAVTPHTTVIIIGDARNNYNDAQEWALKEIKARAKRVIWMNPEPRTSWGFGDSEMKTYAQYCDITEEVRNLKQLTQMVDRLVMS